MSDEGSNWTGDAGCDAVDIRLNSVFRGLSGGTANIHGDADTNTSGHDAKC